MSSHHISPTDKTGFDHTTYKNIEERITNMLLHQYWDYITDQINDKSSHLRKHLSHKDAKKLNKEGPVSCLAITLAKNSQDIQYSRTFSTAIGK